MSLHPNKRKHKLGALAAASVALLLLTGCAVDTETLLYDTVSGVSQAVLNALLDAFSSYLAST